MILQRNQKRPLGPKHVLIKIYRYSKFKLAYLAIAKRVNLQIIAEQNK